MFNHVGEDANGADHLPKASQHGPNELCPNLSLCQWISHDIQVRAAYLPGQAFVLICVRIPAILDERIPTTKKSQVVADAGEGTAIDLGLTRIAQ